MSWYEDPNCEAAAEREHIVIAYAADLAFPSGNVRLTTWTDTLSIDGNDFTPAMNGDGQLLVAIQESVERAQLYAERWTYQLSGVDPSVVPESEIDDSLGSAVIEYEIYIDPDTRQMIGFETVREGTISKIRRLDANEPLIEVHCEHRLVILEDSDGWRYTKQHQEKFFSGDLGCDFAASLESKEVQWGGKRVVAGGFYRNVIDRAIYNAQNN